MSIQYYSMLLSKLAYSVHQIEAETFPKFPFYREQNKSAWEVSTRGAWCAGFWVGCCWLTNYFFDKNTECTFNKQRRQQLLKGCESRSVFQAMNAWYGFGPAWKLAEDMDAYQAMSDFQRPLATIFEHWGGFSLGSDMGGGERGSMRLSIDPCAALMELSCVENWHEMPRSHAKQMVNQLLKPSGGAFNLSEWVGETHGQANWSPYGKEGGWERGQCWAMLALCSATFRMTSQSDYLTWLTYTEKVCEFWWKNNWRETDYSNDPLKRRDSQLDPSATLMAVVAMFKLDDLLKGDSLWRQRGKLVLDLVLNSNALKQYEHTVRFVGCRYRVAAKEIESPNQSKLIEMPYGYFFLYQALLIASGSIKAGAF